jgi:hypothetical protein
VHYWLSSRGLPLDEDVVSAIFAKAKASNRVLEDGEIAAIVHEHSATA